MYTIISGTNREDSFTQKVASVYKEILESKGVSPNMLTLMNINVLSRNEEFLKMERELLIPTKKFIFIIPEYNGSYPGILKTMIDTSDIKESWWWKKALLTGVSAGRAGNLRGMDHLNGTLQYLKMFVHPNKLPISTVDTLFDASGAISHTPTNLSISSQLDEFIDF